MIWFQDVDEHQMDHEKFKRWQQDHKSGYVLNFPEGGPIRLHQSGCGHIADFSDEDVSLTKAPKLCSKNPREIRLWAEENSVAFTRCRCLK